MLWRVGSGLRYFRCRAELRPCGRWRDIWGKRKQSSKRKLAKETRVLKGPALGDVLVYIYLLQLSLIGLWVIRLLTIWTTNHTSEG
jgi:hypothetical protein